MNAANLLNFLACLTVIADASDREDAEDSSEFFWLGVGRPGLGLHLPDGRVLRHW